MTSSTTSSIYGSSVSGKGIGGLMSGLDTESLVEQMLQSTQAKINRQFQAQQKLVYQQDAFRDVISKLTDFSSKYFSYTSKTNILSSSFFKSNTVTSSNSNINVSGDTDAIKNLIINSVTSVATKSSLLSNKKVSSGKFEASFSTENEVLKNQLANQSITISVDEEVSGQTSTLTQTLTISSNFAGSTLQEVADELNKGINADGSKLKDKVKYTVVDNKLVLGKVDANVKTTKVSAVSNNISDILNIKVSTDGSSSDVVDSSKIVKRVNLKDALLSGSITLNFNGVNKSLTFSENDLLNIDFTNLQDPNTQEKVRSLLSTKINKAFGDGKIDVSLTSGNLVFKTNSTTDLLTVNSVSSDINKLIGLAPGQSNRINPNISISSDNLNGLSGVKRTDYKLKVNGKEISVNNNMSIQDIMTKIETDANVNVTYDAEKGTFTATDKTDSTKVYKFEDVENGGNVANALFNSTNKNINLNSTLKDSSISGLVTDEYEISINGVNFKFNNTNSIRDIINTVNSSNAGVKLSYSSLNDTFSAVSTETGSHTKIDIKDVSGNLVNTLFGDSTNLKNTVGQDTVMSITMNGTTQNIVRSSDSFSIDGVNFELSSKAEGISVPVEFTVNSNIDEIVENMAKFVNDYNEIVTYLDAKLMETPNKKYPPLTDAQKKDMSESEIKLWEEKAKEGMLYCDSNISSLLYGLKDAVSGFVSGNNLLLSDIGIASAKGDYSGKLVFDEDKFRKNYAENSDKIENLFTQNIKDGTTADKGIAYRLRDVFTLNVGTAGEKGLLVDKAGTKGTTTAKNNFLSERIEDYEDMIKKLKTKMEGERARYWKQFTSLESALSKLNSQSSWLSQQFQ